MTKLATIGLLFTFLVAAGAMYGQPASADNRHAVIISFRQAPGDADEAFMRLMGGTVKRRFRIIPAMAARLPQSVIDALRKSPAVASIEADIPIHALDEYTATWGVSRVGAKLVHDGGNLGTNLKVCVIDSGVDYNHTELAANFNPANRGYDFVNDDSDPLDDNGHGTHVAGSIAAALNGVNIVGVAPQVQILAYKILDSTGSGSFSDAIAAVERCQADGGKVTNNSYGASTNPGTAVQLAFDQSYAAGLLHVASAGNSGSGTDTVGYPAKFSSVIAVAATDQSDNRASFSSTGPTVELAAPGVSILSTYLNVQYAYASGTSMASPHVAGIAALVLNCGITSNTAARTRMQQTAQDLGTAGRDNLFGYGLARADLAAINCQAPPPPPQIPAAPSNLTAATGGTRRVNLAWKDNSNNETQFVIERCQGPKCTSFAALATVGAGVTAYADTTVSRRVTYSYRVKARNSAGDSTYSNIAQIKAS